MRLAGPLILALLLLGGCGELPRPFKQADQQAFDLRVARERNTIQVQGPQSLPDRRKADFEQMIVEGLRENGLSARRSAAPRPGYARLLADSVVAPGDSSQTNLQLSWRLFSMDDELLLKPVQERQISPGSWTNGDSELLASLSDELVTEISESFGYTYRPPALAPEELANSSNESGTPPESRPEQTTAVTTSEDPADPAPQRNEQRSGEVIVLPIEEAPGDGRESLEIAMMQVLRDAGVPVRRVPEIQDFLLEVDVELGAPREGMQRIQIVWTLLSARDFSEIGTLTQDNQIPAGSLDGEWGETAYAISRAAADGLVELLREAGLARSAGQ
ncbi:hypothetical protein [Fodinicurvata fenggangensis]|uniref:hypothetical protein n=1 Tax=Fodinicurvata fenggangensis TaxID=1121830 RepID=UPI00047BC1BE|nr:hypothetical protein [Fodinicurvata fenggangensis]